MKRSCPIDVLDFDDALWVTSDWFDRMDAARAMQMTSARSLAPCVFLSSIAKHNAQPRAAARRAPSLHLLTPASVTDDKRRDFDIICRIKAPIHAVPDLVNKFVFSWTALAFNYHGIGTFQGISDKDVDNLHHQQYSTHERHRTVGGTAPHRPQGDVNRLGGAACSSSPSDDGRFDMKLS